MRISFDLLPLAMREECDRRHLQSTRASTHSSTVQAICVCVSHCRGHDHLYLMNFHLALELDIWPFAVCVRAVWCPLPARIHVHHCAIHYYYQRNSVIIISNKQASFMNMTHYDIYCSCHTDSRLSTQSFTLSHPRSRGRGGEARFAIA